ncbi:MAG: undecaprenyldiphospho-muramoylpentapeptide beta-N-acetylglucosaminyltransferase [Bacteroidales bacterium]|nr:undecaprenyldiphospho-muramoylpentapeptide beta-N-acetylglucosaminyltransferase [Bacteroidales bacterium]
MNKKSNIRIIISGGGTGGHLFPAIAIANALKKINPEIEILFVGALGRMEMEKVPAAGYQIIGLPVEGFNRKHIYKNIRVIFKLLKSLWLSRTIIRKFRPHAAIGVGGYASGPLLWMASFSKIPIYIQEQNSYAGITNKLLAKRAKRIFVAYSNMEKFFPAKKIHITGNPVREGIELVHSLRLRGIEHFKLSPQRKTILCLGGSLGARSINDAIVAYLEWFYEQQHVQLIWQCGKIYFERLKSLVEPHRNVLLLDFISDMELAYAAADLIISRAGAGTISELCIVGKPVILVPSPNVAEDHQTKNALTLTNVDAAIMIPDNEAKVKLLPEAVNLLTNTEKCAILSENIKKLALPDAAQHIAHVIVNDLNES